MTPDQSPGLGTNPTRYYTLIDGRLQPVDTHVWGIETQEMSFATNREGQKHLLLQNLSQALLFPGEKRRTRSRLMCARCL